MGRVPREITATELSLLNELWQRTSATVPVLTESLYGNTLPTLLATDRTQWPHHYSAAVKREDIAGTRLQATADELYNGELAKLLPYLIRSQKLSASDRANFRKVFDELD